MFFLVSESQEQIPDVCQNSEIIPFDSIRMYAYERPRREPPLCDRNLINETKWYRATDDMVTNATKADICGTSFPLWLSGIIFMHIYRYKLLVKNCITIRLMNIKMKRTLNIPEL